MKLQSVTARPNRGRPPHTSPGLLSFRAKRESARPRRNAKPRGPKEPDLIVTDTDLRRGEALHLMAIGIITASEACRLLRVSRSRMYKLLAEYRLGGVTAIASKKRGGSSNRAYPPAFRKRVLAIIEDLYADYGPTLAAEMLEEVHDIAVSRETLRTWMIEAGIWITNRAARRRIHRPRKRMPIYGDLVQIDGSDHDWFEDRAPRCTAMVMVDDATGRLQVLHFAPTEDRDAYFTATHSYVVNYGRPGRIQTDKHSAVWSANGPTEYDEALDGLTIIHSVAHSPQSKGRVERCNRTLQDRLVKALRREGIGTIDEANAFAPEFIKKYNERFARPAARPGNNHRAPRDINEVDSAFSWRDVRCVTKNLTFSFGGARYVIEDVSDRDLIGREVTIEIRLDGVMVVLGACGELKVHTIQ